MWPRRYCDLFEMGSSNSKGNRERLESSGTCVSREDQLAELVSDALSTVLLAKPLGCSPAFQDVHDQ